MQIAYYKKKMTLAEIKTKVPELQTKIADLVKDNEADKQRLSEIDVELEEAEELLQLEKNKLKPIEEYIAKNKSNPSKKIQGSIKAQETLMKTIKNSIKTQQDIIKQKTKEKADIMKPDSEYSKRAAEAEKAKTELNEICDILVQDPTINYQMQTAVMARFDEKIEKENAKKEAYQKASKDIGEALKDDSAGGLKSLLEDVKKGKEELDESLEDPSKDSNAAKIKYLDAKKKLVSEIKSKFGVDVKPMDIDYMISAMESNKLDNLSLPSLETAIKDIEAVVEKMEQSKEKTLASIEAKKVVGDIVPTQEMEDNKKEIERLTGEVDTLTTEIDDIDAELAKLDKDIEEKEKEMGESSKKSKELEEFEKAEENLRDENIIIDELIPGFDDPDSDISKKYDEFEKVDLALRKAFQECKLAEEDADREKSITDLKDAIAKYQKVSEELSTLSGYDIKAWQNYLQDDLNARAMDKEELDSAYYHTKNQNFKSILDDRDVMKKGMAIDEYQDVENSLKRIDSAQEKILNGDFSIEAEKLFKDENDGYFKLMDEFQNASGLTKTKGLMPDVTVYDLLRDNKMIERKPLAGIRNFFKRIVSRFKTNKPFETSIDRQEAIDRYRDAKTADVEKEIEERKDLDELIRRRKDLKKERDDKSKSKSDKKVELAEAEKKQEDLEKAAPTRTSSIEATETEMRKVTYKDKFIQGAVDREIEDEGR